MTNTMTYKSYMARVEYDPRDEIFVGRVLGIEDRITFHGATVGSLRRDFRAAIDHYLATVPPGPGPAETLLGEDPAPLGSRGSRPRRHVRGSSGQEPQPVGGGGAGPRELTGAAGLRCWFSRDHREGVSQVARYGQVIVDECHHVPANSFERALSEARARYVVGLTAPRGVVTIAIRSSRCTLARCLASGPGVLGAVGHSVKAVIGFHVPQK